MRRLLFGLAVFSTAAAGLAGCASPTPTAAAHGAPSKLLNRLPQTETGTCKSNVAAKPTATSSRQVAEAERIAMPSTQFWQLIATLHGSNSDAAYHRLSATLAELPLKSILGFDARLTLVLYALDDECRAQWYTHHDPSGLGFVADDDFLYFRADTVTAGQTTWKTALVTDTLPWGSTDPVNGDGGNLLYVGLDAAGRHGIDDASWMDRESTALKLSYETGSNPAGWPPTT